MLSEKCLANGNWHVFAHLLNGSDFDVCGDCLASSTLLDKVFSQAYQIQRRTFWKVLNMSFRVSVFQGEESPCLFDKDYWVIVVFEAESEVWVCVDEKSSFLCSAKELLVSNDHYNTLW